MSLATQVSDLATRVATEIKTVRTEIAAVNSSKAPVIHLHTKGDISDFTEAVQDEVGAMVAAAGGTYDDTAGAIALPKGYFRGIWSGMSVLSSIDVGASMPAAFSSTSGWLTKLTTTGLVNFPFGAAGGVAPTDDYVVSSGTYNGGPDPGSWKTATTFVVPAGCTRFRVKCLLPATGDPTNQKLGIYKNGTQVYVQTSTLSWVETVLTVAPGDVIGLSIFERWSSSSAEARFGQFEFGVAASAYNIGDYVFHNAKLYRSLTNANATTPGNSSEWVLAEFNYFDKPVARSSVWYTTEHDQSANGSASLATNVVRAMPFLCTKSGQFSTLSFLVNTTVASGQCNVAVYRDSDGVPGTKIAEGTAVETSASTGIRELTVSGIAVTAGELVWLAVRAVSTSTLRVYTSGLPGLGMSPIPVLAGPYSAACYELTGQASFPSSWPSSWTYQTNAPIMFVKYA